VHALAVGYHWLPLGLVLVGLGCLVKAVRCRVDGASWRDIRLLAPPLLFFSVDATMTSESVLERACKGAAAVLITVNALIFSVRVWRRRLHDRVGVREAER
jgi:hypothetical protein